MSKGFFASNSDIVTSTYTQQDDRLKIWSNDLAHISG